MDLERIKPLLEKKVNELGYDLYSLTFAFKEGNHVLTLTIDRVEPISMNDIVKVTDVISPYLDEIDDSTDPYMLEITSLGVEKPLKIEDLAKYISSYIEVRLINPLEGENIYLGYIKEVKEDSFDLEFKIKTRTKVINITYSNISKIRKAIKF